MTHIAHLETGRHLYGGARQVLYLLDGLTGKGVQSTLICPPDSEIYLAANQANLNVVPISMAGDLDFDLAGRVADWLANHQPGLLHVHSRRGADFWGGLAARRAGVPAVLTRRVDNPDIPFVGSLKYRLYERVIAISDQIRTELRSAGVPDAQLRLVHSAVREAKPPAWTREQFLDAFDLEQQHITVFCVAQFIARKGHAYLLDAWPEVLSECPDARLLLFGQGREETSLRTQADRLGISNSLRFAGFREDLHEFMGHADLLVHPALREGLGVCLLEAQAAGMPVVASRAGGIPEVVAEGETGLLVTPGQVAELAGAVVAMVRDAERRQRMAAAGPAHIARHFSAEGMVSGNLEVYREVLGVLFKS